MKKRKITVFALIFTALMLPLTAGCAAEPKLEPVVTLGIPEKEKLVETIKINDFVFNIYNSYAELAGYEGDDTNLLFPKKPAAKTCSRLARKPFGATRH